MSDSVNHPAHYTSGDIECIDAIKAACGEHYEGYLQGNAMKYLWRYRLKGRPVKRCRRELKDRLCSIKGQRRLSQAQRVDASWMAEQLRSYRSHGVSAAEMARRIGCDRQVVDALLHGKRGRVRAETLYKFMLAKPGLDEMRKSG